MITYAMDTNIISYVLKNDTVIINMTADEINEDSRQYVDKANFRLGNYSRQT